MALTRRMGRGDGVEEKARAPERRGRERALLAAGMLLPALLFLFLLPTFFYSVSPGSAEAVEEHIRVEGYLPLERGNLYLTSVSIDPLSTAGMVAQALGGAGRMESLRELLGPGRSMEEYNAGSDRLMQLSQETAAAVALRECGYGVPEEKSGVLVLGVSRDAPAASVLGVGDVITGVGGRAVEDVEGLRAALTEANPGDTVELTLRRGGEDEGPVEVSATTTTLPDDAGRTALGISVRDLVSYDFPLKVDIELKGYSGPSAGLMLTLGIINIIRGGELVGDSRVAGTGEIMPDGRVGPIGGIDLKIRTAAAVGARLFLAPSSNYGEITVFTEGLLVVPVDDIDDALAALEALREQEGR